MSEGFPCGAGISIPGPAGALEAIAGCPPPGAVARAAVAVVCHPHPLHGGTMHNKVVHTLARAFERLGARSLRFNFRGVGASAGAFDGGRGETGDALAALAWVRKHRPGDELWLAGFSFGAAVALRAATRFPIARLVTVAPAVNLYPDLHELNIARIPWLLVQGRDDEVVPAPEVIGWAQGRSPRPELVVLDGVGHFFHGRLRALTAAVSEHIAPTGA
jgi:alpha/beta superfamily hydrolase